MVEPKSTTFSKMLNIFYTCVTIPDERLGERTLSLYENIRNRRIALGLTQQELADIIGYESGKSMIAKIENGRVDLTQSKIIQFAQALRTTPGDLMGWEEQLEEINTDQLVDFMLSEEDREMYSDFCNLSDTDKQIVRSMIKALASKGEA